MSIVEDIKKDLPKDAMITDILYEGSEIILYTKNKRFFKSAKKYIKPIVKKVKKRIEVRADPKLLLNEEKTEEYVRKIVPSEAKITEIYFEPEFAKLIVHAKKPGLVIGKNGETLEDIRTKTFWTVIVERSGMLESDLIRNIRRMIHIESGYRKKFLHNLGVKIYGKGKNVDWIRLSALGGFREVGRSSLFLQTPETRILMDCGASFSSSRQFPYLEAPEFNIQDLDAVIVSHAHMDHCGMVPYLYEYGYKGPVYCTKPTRDLMVLLQLDYIQIFQRANKKPPYTSKGIEEMIKHCITLDYGEVTDIAPDVRLTLENAGHILGSSSVHLNIGNGTYNLLYSGDIKFSKTKLLDPASTNYARVEGLIIESTYGADDDIQPKRSLAEKKLIDIVNRTVKRGGKVLIPAFSVGRSQEVSLVLSENKVDVPIILDGMILDATAIHTVYPEFLSKRMQNLILHKQENPFLYDKFKGIGSQKERQEVLNSSEPMIIISTSGMLNGGPILEYLKRFGSDERNTLVFVGYQAEGTMGRRIQKGWKTIPLENPDGSRTTLELKLDVETIDGFSGHADRNELMQYVKSLKTTPRRIVIDHGEKSKTISLARAFHKSMGVETISPRNLEVIRFK